jgi:hypothetical protein
MNSGVFVCERGTSNTYTGLLTKQDVLDASTTTPLTKSGVSRMVGGGFLDTLKSVISNPVVRDIGKQVLEKGADLAIKKITGGGASGGGASGGRLRDRLM